MPQTTNQKIVRRATGQPSPGGWRQIVEQTYQANKVDILTRTVATYEQTLQQLAAAQADVQSRLDAARAELAAAEGGSVPPPPPENPD